MFNKQKRETTAQFFGIYFVVLYRFSVWSHTGISTKYAMLNFYNSIFHSGILLLHFFTTAEECCNYQPRVL